MNKHVLVLVAGILCLHVKYTHAQKQQDYIATDSSLSAGVNLERNTPRFNSQYIILKVKGGETKYTPEQIKEFGFRDGTVYESKKIVIDNEERKVFLERLATGNITLYRYVGRNQRAYYIKKDSSDLQELYRDLGAIKTLSQDCEFMTDAIRVAAYTHESLRKLVSHYNTCAKKPFPYTKIGILAGWRNMSLTQSSKSTNSYLEDVSIPSSGSPVIGIFGDLPLSMSEFSLHPEILYTWNNFASNTHTAQSDIDVLINLKTLQMPILFRYTVPTLNWRLFVDAGPSLTYNLENSSDIYYSKTIGNTVSIERPAQEKLLADFTFGYAAGVGLQRQLNYRKTLSAEVRYSSSVITAEDAVLVQKGIDLVIGFTF